MFGVYRPIPGCGRSYCLPLPLIEKEMIANGADHFTRGPFQNPADRYTFKLIAKGMGRPAPFPCRPITDGHAVASAHLGYGLEV